MDEHNVHQFWGLSPAIDMFDLMNASPSHGSGVPRVDFLQVSPYDPRHTVYTMARASRHHETPTDVHIYVYEEAPEVLARHVLLIAILLDESLLLKERMQRFLEVFGNALLREDTAKYLFDKTKELEDTFSKLAAGESPETPLARLFSLSDLKYADRDGVIDAFKSARRPAADFDMVKSWDTRCRHWYGERFDFQRNMIDWDYHMRLAPAGTPGLQPEDGSIIHFYHFRHWRATGVAYELREANYIHPNKTLLSTATGRTKDFKDRNGKDVGRSVSAFGLWCDILCSPYHSFGTQCEDPAFYKKANKEFGRTAVDVSEHNVLTLLTELRTGARAAPSGTEADVHRAKLARGPTDLADLQAASQPPATRALDAITEEGPDENEPDAACVSSDNVARDKAEALRVEERELNAAAAERVERFTIHLVSGCFLKQLSSRRKFAELFCAATVGNRHAHLLQPEWKLSDVMRPGSAVAVESAKYLVNLKQPQADQVKGKVVEWGGAGGFVERQEPVVTIADAHVLLTKP